MRLSRLTFTVTLLLYTSVATATIIKVPQDQPTIQAGIDSAFAGDTVLVDTGKYVENINFNGKNVVVGSLFLTTRRTSYISQTVIDGNRDGSVVTFENGEDTTAMLNGVTIQNGLGRGLSNTGGGITCSSNSNPKLFHLRIINNWGFPGSAIYCENSDPIIDNIHVSGNQTTVYDAGEVITFINSNPIFRNSVLIENVGTDIFIYQGSISITNLIISNNDNYGWTSGGIYCINSELTVNDVTIQSNSGVGIIASLSTISLAESNIISNAKGGIQCSHSLLTLHDVTLRDNSGRGGIYSTSSTINLSGVLISGNEGSFGGGVWCDAETVLNFDFVNRCNIFNNDAIVGKDLYGEDNFSHIILDTFTVESPTNYYITPSSQFTYDFENYRIEQIASDLYVSPDGDNSNNGLSLDRPLKTIDYALSKIYADSLHPRTIHLSKGIYHAIASEEEFSLHIPDYVTLVGSDADSVILDGDSSKRIINCYYASHVIIEGITLRNAYSSSAGAGIYLKNSNLLIQDVIIKKNKSIGQYAAGIWCYESSPTISNVVITDNYAYSGSGITCWKNSNPLLINVTLSGNTATAKGGGIYVRQSSHPVLKNSIVWGNQPQQIYFSEWNEANSITVSYSDIQGGEEGTVINGNGSIYWLEGNIDSNPVFCDPEVGNYTLGENSPCFEAGEDGANMGALDVGCPSKIVYEGPIWYISTTGSDETGTGTDTDPFATIQHGIDMAANGDTVLVNPGMYRENIRFNGRKITVGSLFLIADNEEYISQTIIDGNQRGSVARFENGEDLQTVLVGFTLTNGSGNFTKGGGVYFYNSSPWLLAVRIVGNTISYGGEGGGIYCENSNPRFENLVISDNSVPYGKGGGIFCMNSSPILQNVLIVENTAGYSGGGIFCKHSNPYLFNVTITENSAPDYGGGIASWLDSSPILFNSIIWNNLPEGIYLYPDSNEITIGYSNVLGGENGIVTNDNGMVYWLEGNIDNDPLFVDLENGDFNLQQESPCIDAGTPFFVWEGDTLLNLPDTGYEGNAPDMGVFESPYTIGINSGDAVPGEFILFQNYPNPFNPTTIIEFSIPRSGIVMLTVYDVLGRKVETILNDYRDVGYHKLQWNASNIPSGIYFVRMQSGDFSQVRKATVVR